MKKKKVVKKAVRKTPSKKVSKKKVDIKKEHRLAVRAMREYGLSVKEIAIALDINARTLDRRCATEIGRIGKTGKKQFKPTEEDKRMVESLRAFGMAKKEITLMVKNPRTEQPINIKTLEEQFEIELLVGAIKMNANVSRSIYQKAIGDGPHAMTAATLWAKCRMKWTTTEKVEVTGKEGAPIEVEMETTDSSKMILKQLLVQRRKLDEDEEG